ncbi:MAG: hypothetical protein MK033_02915 [Candidatus Caenarcaniphilales bacterium]|nr:hypothetical protein [Candidatus Caenarcaniphilales bacterium]
MALVQAGTINEQLSNSYIDLEFGYRMDAYEDGSNNLYIVASTKDNADYMATIGEAMYDQFDTQTRTTATANTPATTAGPDNFRNHLMYYQTETEKYNADGSVNTYTRAELLAGNVQTEIVGPDTFRLGGIAITDEFGNNTLTYSSSELDAEAGGKLAALDIDDQTFRYDAQYLNDATNSSNGIGYTGSMRAGVLLLVK